jgi:hypothetical protein
MIPLAPGLRLPLRSVARFRVSSDRGGYWLEPLRRPRGVAETIAVAPQRSAPTPGVTLRLTLAQASRFRTVGLRARITPVAVRPG